jgi:hypothetical protein
MLQSTGVLLMDLLTSAKPAIWLKWGFKFMRHVVDEIIFYFIKPFRCLI